ncbi:MAG: nuclear transport factor 2 family protein [Vicinamibacterales bacterium]
MARLQHDVKGVSPAVAATVTAFQLDAFARRYYECFNQRSFDEAEMFVDPRAVFTYPLAKEHLIGRAGYRELARRWLAGFPDARITITAVHVLDDRTAATDWIGEGTHLGLLELPGLPPIPATGVHTTLPMRETITITDGRITGSRMDFEPAELARRLGLML